MSITTNSTTSVDPAGGNGQNYTFALSVLTFLFFIWGFITCLNDILIPHLKNVFDLTNFQASLIQFCFFFAYFVVSIPAGFLVKKVGYQRGAVIGLVIAAVGCLMFYPASQQQVYAMFLLALFVLASGITILQVSANPYVTALGRKETASSRLTWTQAFNSLGTTIAPYFGGLLILSAATAEVGTAEYKAQEAAAVQGPYLLLAGALVLLAVVFQILKLPKVVEHHDPVVADSDSGSAWQHSHLVLGALGIFLYVGGEVAIGSYMIGFISLPEIAGFDHATAANMLQFYWGGAMVGRFVGAGVMQYVPAGKVLAFNAVAVMVLLAATVMTTGHVAMWSVLLIGLFNSIMFPTIFSLAVTGLGRHTSQGSGVLCLAIVGGAIVPVLQGILADAVGIQLSYALPIVCYAYIVFYGLKGSVPKQS
jgi:FHS family L-fucose permease-like MFS transporter